MSKRVHKTPEELRAAWVKRQERIRASTPGTFKQFCVQCLNTSIYYMNLGVYGSAKPNKRTGIMKKREKLVPESPTRTTLINDAQTRDGHYYARDVHDGRRAMSAPTPNNKLAFAWLLDPRKVRPDSGDKKAWKSLVKSGQAVVVKSVKATEPVKWRDKMVEEMKGKFAKFWVSEVFAIFGRP